MGRTDWERIRNTSEDEIARRAERIRTTRREPRKASRRQSWHGRITSYALRRKGLALALKDQLAAEHANRCTFCERGLVHYAHFDETTWKAASEHPLEARNN